MDFYRQVGKQKRAGDTKRVAWLQDRVNCTIDGASTQQSYLQVRASTSSLCFATDQQILAVCSVTTNCGMEDATNTNTPLRSRKYARLCGRFGWTVLGMTTRAKDGGLGAGRVESRLLGYLYVDQRD